MTMKRILMIVTVLTFCASLSAQNLVKEQVFRAKFPWKYELRIGYGGYPLMDSEQFLNPYSYCECEAPMFPELGNMYSPKIKNEYMTGILSAEFSIHFKRWFSLAFNLGVNGMWRTMSDPLDGGDTFAKRGASFNLIPTARFQYVNSKYVRMYTGIGLGLYVGCFDGEVLVTASLTNNNITKEVNFTVSVERPIPETIEINKEIEIVLGETYQLQWALTPQEQVQAHKTYHKGQTLPQAVASSALLQALKIQFLFLPIQVRL